ncbi:auxin-responsive protein SAUR71-like [Canna indica]|uniref:Auxin-responsive protein SAUR71-like n=1 Tax=Canna indica TaxID=4628 RepID=A0AAQ3K3S6_9LILI|nr:auxin-responsive protein SAUR71-like [Canna indica]
MIRRLSRVADSSSRYERLPRQRTSNGRRRGDSPTAGAAAATAAQGHVPVYVGEEMERFEIRTGLLNHPAFVELLRRSAQEYGYEQTGVLRIPCPVPLFRRLLAASGSGEAEAEELLRSFDEWFLSSEDPS